MKKQLFTLVCAIAVSSAAMAQDTTTTTKTTAVKEDGSTETTVKTTTTSGTITEYVPGTTFIVKETSGPVTYHYGKKVIYVTKSGKPLSEADVKTRIKVGVPVSVDYGTEGEHKVITRVVIED